MPVWDRLRGGQKDEGAPAPSRQKLEAWQNAHSSSYIGRGRGNARGGIQGGNDYYQYTVSGGPAPKRPPREFQDRNKLAPPGPPAQAAASKNSYRDSDYGRPASSVYSQPSPVAATHAAQQLKNDVTYNDPNEVSPPSSPEALNPRYRSSTQDAGDVSPIDEIPDMSQLTTGPPDPLRPESRTGIPQLRRERRKNSDAATTALRQQKSSDRLSKQPRPYGHDVRWDPNTGEPTTSNKGRPSQVDPREFAQGLGNGNNTSVSPRHIKQAQQSLSAFGERVRRMRGPSESAPPPPPPPPPSQPEPAPRPEWRGASGRAPLAPPLKDSHHVAPLRIAPKSDKGAEPGRGPSTSTPASTATASANTAVGSRNISSPLGRSPRTEESNSNGGGAVGSNKTIRSTNQTSAAAGQQLSSNSSWFPASAKAEGSPDYHSVSNGSFATVKHADPPRPRQQQQQQQPASSKPPVLSPPEPPAPAAQPPPSGKVLQVPTNEKATKRKSIGAAAATAAIGHKPHPSGSSSVYSQPDIQPARSAALATAIAAAAGPPSAAVAAAAAVDDWIQPPSRFSVTTYGTSNPTESYRASTDYDEEDAPPLPPPPPITDSPLRPSSAASSSSIMERGRPIVPGYEKSPRLSPSNPVRINLGASHNTAGADPKSSNNNNNSNRPPTTASHKPYGTLSVRPVSRSGSGGGGGGGGGEKDLPLAPPELAASNSAADRVAQLNARLQALGNRRINLHTAIRQMTELMPTDSVLASDAVARKREAEKRKVEALRRELADVERESYDLGLSLHRAYKRLDREAEYEPTGLWVRRVTG